MHKRLSVLLGGTLVGYFEQNAHGKNVFKYAADYLASSHSMAISVSLPLQEQAFDDKTTHNFFAGILPEDQQRQTIAYNLGISANNDYSMLERIGGDCAGALSIGSLEIKPNVTNEYKELSKLELFNILQELPTRPLLAGDFEIRMSLAGVQDKLAVAVHANKIFLPLNGAPSTHILKPEIPGYEFNTVTNEAYCLKLAAAIGLQVAGCNIDKVEGKKFLLVERYDRFINVNGSFDVTRLHQEDFCQALNIAPEKKYQAEGGPSLEQGFDLLRKYSTQPIESITRLLDAIFFNFIVGNCDAHGKNFSLLYASNKIILAPLYDILCTRIYPHLSNKMAMKIGGEYVLDKVGITNFKKFLENSGLNQTLSLRRFLEINELVLEKLEHIELQDENFQQIADFIRNRALHIKLYMK